MKYTKHYSRTVTPQTAPIPGKNQVQNSAGGYSFEVDEWQQMRRFLILGTEGGSYYASEKKLTIENATHCQKLIEKDGPKAVQMIVEVSFLGKAHKNDGAIFLLALAASSKNQNTRNLALKALPKVCRTGTHLLHFASFVSSLRGWGRSLCTAMSDWYTQEASDVAYQVAKYQQRDGWSHRDVLRKAHPVPQDLTHQALFHWITTGNIPVEGSDKYDNFVKRVGNENLQGVPNLFEKGGALEIIGAMNKIQNEDIKASDAVNIIADYKLPRECIPTGLLNNPDVWNAMLQHMPLTAMIRNLGKMSAINLLKPNSDAAKKVCESLRNSEYLHKSRVHPITVLAAMRTYVSGHGVKGSLSWNPVQTVVDALDDAFYSAFDNIDPTNKRWVLGLDVSGSMTYGNVSGVIGLTPRDASAALAMVTARTEKEYCMMAFCHEPIRFDVSAKERLDSVVNKMEHLSFGGTDCSLPMVWAMQNKIAADIFAVYTDSETYFGDNGHPCQVLEQYRKTMNIPDSKLAVVGMNANKFSIADPEDHNMMDFVGMDVSTPEVMAEFAKGNV